MRNVVGMGRDVDNAATFSTRFKFPENLCDFFTPKEEYAAAVKAAGPEFAEIISLPGVCYARVYSSDGDLYTLSVKKSAAFTWEELEPRIVSLLELRHDRMEEEV
jgi:hypothetical protein